MVWDRNKFIWGKKKMEKIVDGKVFMSVIVELRFIRYLMLNLS